MLMRALIFHLEKKVHRVFAAGNSVVVELIATQRGRRVSFIRYSGLAYLGKLRPWERFTK